MGVKLILSLVFILCYIVLINCKIWEIPFSESLKDCYNRANRATLDTYVGSVFSWHCEHIFMESTYTTKPIPKETITFVNQILDFEVKNTTTKGPNRPSQSLKPCVRKEYRMLTLEERKRYHAAVNSLKKDKSVLPNKYDAIAVFHTESAKSLAHGGPGFLGWHRIYLLTYENALRKVDDRVCLPYWDSTLDSKLKDPFMSSLWTPEFLGDPRGDVITGPFANWVLPNGGQLIRNVAVDGGVLSTDIVNDILSRNTYDEIVTSKNVNPRYLLELHHGLMHKFVGGTMDSLLTSAFEPIYFMHQAFIDYIWERFRAKLRKMRVNPELYPSTDNPLHQGNVPTGFASLTHADGYSEKIAQRVTYQPVPTCNSTSSTCGAGSSLVCRTSDWLCIPTTRTLSVPKPKSQAAIQDNCINQTTTYALPNQNDFCVGYTCDTDEWVMIPVEIISVRPPKFGKYDSYPVKKGRIDNTRDIYAPNAKPVDESEDTEDTNKFIFNRQGNLKTYDRCEVDTAVGQIFLYSIGINYPGYYKESTMVDQKLTVSVSLGFVGVKKPSELDNGVSLALLRAHDYCGRVCQVNCKDSFGKNYKCSGAISLDDMEPYMYGRSVDEAVLSVIDFSIDDEAPDFKASNVLITFYCDYRENFPFASPFP